MPHNQSNFPLHHVIGNRNRLFRITNVIANHQPQLFTQYPTPGINVRNRHLNPFDHLFAQCRDRAGNWTGKANQYFFLGLGS